MKRFLLRLDSKSVLMALPGDTGTTVLCRATNTQDAEALVKILNQYDDLVDIMKDVIRTHPLKPAVLRNKLRKLLEEP